MPVERPPCPPFTRETAIQKVRGAEDGRNSCDPERYLKSIRWIALGATAVSSSMAVPPSLPF